MTIPVRVTVYNIEESKGIARNGPVPPDVNAPCGANYVIRPDTRRLRLGADNLDIVADMIEPGWTVERHLQDGDIVLLNRQPSLHRMSILAHRVKIMEGRTFRLNPAACPPYNANFDGGEMNMHVPQTEEARAEVRFSFPCMRILCRRVSVGRSLAVFMTMFQEFSCLHMEPAG